MSSKCRTLVVDLETTINAPAPHFGAAPHHPDNHIVLIGYKADDEDIVVTENPEEVLSLIGRETLIIGHNLSFDLLYLDLIGDLPPTVKLWDTQKFDYLLCGRNEVSPSLQTCAERWDVPFTKDIEVSERFRVGIGADHIDRELLTKYLIDDVKTTAHVQKKQATQLAGWSASQSYFLELMTGLRPTIEMSKNGMPFDTISASEEARKLQEKYDDFLLSATKKWSAFWPADEELNLASPKQVNALLWGGEWSAQEREPVVDEDGKEVRYKSGQKKGEIKTRLVQKTLKIPGIARSDTYKIFKRKGWDLITDSKALSRICEVSSGCAETDLANDLLYLRKIYKTISTYFQPYIDYQIKNRIHPNYNHCVTQTGRLSSNKPNMQNISNKGDVL